MTKVEDGRAAVSATPPPPPPTKVQEAALLSLLTYGKRTGWLLSVEHKRPLDARRRPLPWYTYPAIYFLSERITSDMNVFEFGSGNSTLWWGARAKSVISVEHHQGWAGAMQRSAPSNASINYVPLEVDGDYCRAAKTFANGPVDVVVNDGRDRVNCCYNSIDALSDGGVVVWDNADRDRYQPGFDFLIDRGFRRLKFIGHGPINVNQWETSIFYRPDNCLGI